MATQKQKLDRYLRDFPWLWAIKTTWHHAEDNIRVTLLSPDANELDIDAGRCEVWVYGSGVKSSPEEGWISEDRYTVVRATLIGNDNRVGSLAYLAASVNFSAGTEHVAVCKRHRNGGSDGAREILDVQVFRVSAGVSLWELLQKYELSDTKGGL